MTFLLENIRMKCQETSGYIKFDVLRLCKKIIK